MMLPPSSKIAIAGRPRLIWDHALHKDPGEAVVTGAVKAHREHVVRKQSGDGGDRLVSDGREPREVEDVDSGRRAQHHVARVRDHFVVLHHARRKGWVCVCAW